MALLLKKKQVFHFYMPNFFRINELKAGQNMKKHKMIYELNMYESYFDLLIGNGTRIH